MNYLLQKSLCEWTRSELESIPQQEKGDAVINFGNKETIRVHFTPNERQLKLFDGGE